MFSKMKWDKILTSDRFYNNVAIINGSVKRSEFKKDYDAIINSASFRRMQDKTQVFPLSKSDFIRTRLTHSLEVASICKNLGELIGLEIIKNNLDETFDIYQKEKMCNVLECSGLIHDIGNPPFGHFGEIAIRTYFKENLCKIKYNDKIITDYIDDKYLVDLYNFDGNAQGLRLISKLAVSESLYGFNLTYAVLSCMIKYNKPAYQMKSVPFSDKPGYFISEEEIYKEIIKSTQINTRNPLTFILEVADDIAYSTADIEDALKKGFIGKDNILCSLKELEEKNINDSFRPYSLLLSYLNDSEIVYNDKYEYAIKKLLFNIREYLIKCSCDMFIKNYDSIMNGEKDSHLLKGSFAYILLNLLKELGHKYVFNTEFIYKMEISTQKVYDFLLDLYLNSFLYFGEDNFLTKTNEAQKKLIDISSDNYKKSYFAFSKGKEEKYRLYLRLLLVIDIVSGMTDGYAKDLYHHFSGIIK